MLVSTPKRTPNAQDNDPAIISDHPFVPRDEWWSLCEVCGLAQAAHSETTVDSLAEIRKSNIEYYSDDNPEVFD